MATSAWNSGADSTNAAAAPTSATGAYVFVSYPDATIGGSRAVERPPYRYIPALP